MSAPSRRRHPGGLWPGLFGPPRARKPGSPRHQRFAVELLESRTLLTLGPDQTLVPIDATQVSSSDTVLIAALPTSPPTDQDQAAGQVADGLIPMPSDGSAPLVPGSLTLTGTLNGTSVLLPLTGVTAATAAAAGLTPLFTVTYASNDNLADPAASRVLVASPAGSIESTSAPSGPRLPAYGKEADLDAELTPEGIGNLELVPKVAKITIHGVLDGDHAWMTFRMPLGPRTRSVSVSINPGPSAMSGPIRPAVDELYLVDQNGAILAQLKSASANWVGPRQDLAISLASVPEGAQLLVRIVETMPVTGTDQGTSANADPSGTGGDPNGTGGSDQTGLGSTMSDTAGPVPFTMDVSRVESTSPLPASDSGSVVPAGASTWVGSLPVSTGGSLSLPLPPLHTGTTTTAPSAAKSNPDSGGTRQEISASDVSVPEDLGDQSATPGTGPMVSVGSAPLGQAIGAARGDATRPVDRYERAYDLALEGSSAGIDPELIPGVMAGHRRATSGPAQPLSRGGAGDVGPLVALLGPGGYPMLGLAPGQVSEPLDARDVLATLTPPAADASGCEGIAEGPSPRPLEAPVAPRRRVASANLATATLGLLLGIGLTSGPLRPDLLAMIQRGRAGIRSGEPSAAAPGRRRGRLRRLFLRFGSLFR